MKDDTGDVCMGCVAREAMLTGAKLIHREMEAELEQAQIDAQAVERAEYAEGCMTDVCMERDARDLKLAELMAANLELAAERDALRATVERVRELAVQWEGSVQNAPGRAGMARDILATLTGRAHVYSPTPGEGEVRIG